MIKTLVTAAALSAAMISGADAGSKPALLTYEIFEASVPHLDLEDCPAGFAAEDTFCRATLHHEELHVFVFSYEGDSPMVGFQTFPATGLETLLN